jgi:hypothetical protein
LAHTGNDSSVLLRSFAPWASGKRFQSTRSEVYF